MNFIEFTKEHLKFDEQQQEYWLEIPKNELNSDIKSVQIVNDEGAFSDADYKIEEVHSKVKIYVEFPANLRVNF